MNDSAKTTMRSLTATLAACAMLVLCTACSIGGPPAGAAGSSSGGASSDSSSASGSSDSGSSNSSDSPGDSTSVGGSGDAAGSSFCSDLVSAPSADGDDSDATQLQQVVDFWQKLADEAPPEIKPKVSAIVDGYRRILSGDLSATSDQSWVENVTAVSDYFVDHC